MQLDALAQPIRETLTRIRSHFAFYASDELSQRLYRDVPGRAKRLLVRLADRQEKRSVDVDRSSHTR